jgi:antitoxin (DNA-binding transcriptional repressor) of toxin-antitoxin stability system
VYHYENDDVRELRNDFAPISKWLASGETVQITKRGKPFARVSPEPKSKSLLRCMEGTAKLLDEPEAPAGVEWDAMK